MQHKPTGSSRPCLGLYIHIPFCRARCTYCDFNTYADLTYLQEAYVAALIRQSTHLAQAHRSWEVDTVYLGGGTPTSIASHLLLDILAAVRLQWNLTPDAEVTIEANPGTVTELSLSSLRSAGVNRLSMGAQSLLDHELRLLGRIHSASDVGDVVRMARTAGFDNINLDLIYGLPDQSLEVWLSTLHAAFGLHPEHLSLYGLSVEEDTPLERRITSGQLSPPDPDAAADMYQSAEVLLARSGFEHYELSNWARVATREVDGAVDRWYCRHNLRYWRCRPYLGLGAGAHSYIDGERYAMVAQPARYIQLINAGEDPIAEREAIRPYEAMAESMILGLRLIDGLPYRDFLDRHGRSITEQYGQEIRDLVADGLAVIGPDSLSLTPRGRLLANQAFGRFWPPKTAQSIGPHTG